MSDPSTERLTNPAIALSDASPSRTTAPATSEKPRSCAICAQRKVRCDKQFPCGRCRHAGISCVLPSIDRRPQWARHLVSPAGSDARTLSPRSKSAGMAVDKVLERLKHLEGLVKDLSCELEQAHAKSSAAASQPASLPSEASSTHAVDAGAATPPPGRIVLDDSDRVRYVGSGFWSRIDDELHSLKADTRGNESDDTDGTSAGGQSQPRCSSAAEADRAVLDQHSYLLKHNLSVSSYDTSALLPMASQIPFLLEVFSERVHFIIGLPHMPSFKKGLQQRRIGRIDDFSPCEEALVFSVFYAAICSLDDEEVASSFNVSKDELTSRYRTGLEHALAKADFLNNPSDVLLEAFILFLALARRSDNPKSIWMMTGLVIRMAHYLGIQHDGSGSKHISPFQVEMQRRIWWALIALDMRVTEDQGTELGIPHGSYSTKIPSNINDADIWPEMKDSPPEREGLTDVTFLRLCSETARSTQQMMATGATATIDDHNHRLSELQRKWDRDYFSLTDASQHHGYLAAVGTIRIIMGRLTLLAFPPILRSASSVDFSTEIRTKLLVAAIEVAEHNHALNTDSSCLPWRWVYQTQQHWHAIVYILIEICRRPWSSTMERAWGALQSPWLIPVRAPADRNSCIWTPARKLIARARKYRGSEIIRLQTDPEAAARIAREDQQQIPIPSSSTTFPTYFDPETFRERWRQLIRPVVVTTTGALDNTNSTASNNHNPTNHDLYLGSFADVNNVHGTGPMLPDNKPPFDAPLNVGTASSASEPWLGDTIDFNGVNDLDAFLGTNTEMEFLDVMNANNALSFDWNSWFESAKGV